MLYLFWCDPINLPIYSINKILKTIPFSLKFTFQQFITPSKKRSNVFLRMFVIVYFSDILILNIHKKCYHKKKVTAPRYECILFAYNLKADVLHHMKRKLSNSDSMSYSELISFYKNRSVYFAYSISSGASSIIWIRNKHKKLNT